MTYITRRQLLCRIARIAGASLLGAAASEQALASDCSIKVRVAAPLNIGTVRTPAFKVKHKVYRILLLVDGSDLPWQDVGCLLGNQMLGTGIKCSKESLIQGNWSVWDGVDKVAQGLVTSEGGSGETPYERELGHFTGQEKRTYVVEMTFTKDGGPLKGMNPHLVVRQDYDFWCSPM